MKILTDTVRHKVVTGLTKISVAIKSHAWQDAELQKLTPTQGQILTLLQTRGNVPLRLSEIAEGLAVTPATASDAVSVLVDKQLIQKEKAVDDGRAIAIKMTPIGQEKAQSVASWPDFLLSAIDELSEEEQEIFFRGLMKMIRKLQQEQQIPVAKMCVTCHFFHPDVNPQSDRPHYCGLVQDFFGDRHLRLDCPEHIENTDEMNAK